MARVRSGNTGFAVALVIMGCGFMITLLVAIFLYTKIEAAKNAETTAQKKLAEFVSSAEEVEAANYKADGQTAYAGMAAKIAELNTRLNGDGTQVGALQEISDLNAQIAKKDERFTSVSKEKDVLGNQTQAKSEAYLVAVADIDKKLKAEIAEKEDLQAKVSDLQAKVTAAIGDADAAARDRIAELTQQVGELENQIRDLDGVIDQQMSVVAELRRRLPKLPEPNTTLPDGRVASTIGNGRDLFIDLGRRHGVVMGMTFEVFDPDPVIRLNAQGEPRGKATIEVYGLDNDTATCRVVRIDRGDQIDPGDPFVNIAFDPNMTIRMYAFGEFDIEGDGGTSDLERIRGLIVKNGAQTPELTLDDEGIPVLSPDLDYVVLGEKPVLGSPPSEDDFDPEAIAAYQAKKAEVDAYFSISEAAKALRIPVLNQNRFLELIGYYQR